MDRQNKKCSCARNNNGRTEREEENKLAGPLAKKELPAEGCSRMNGRAYMGRRFTAEEDIR